MNNNNNKDIDTIDNRKEKNLNVVVVADQQTR